MSYEESSPFRMSVTGIDGSGKDSATLAVLKHESRAGSAVLLGKPSYMIENGIHTEIFSRTTRTIDHLHEAAERRQSRRLVLGLSATNIILESRILEKYATDKQPKPDILASTRDNRIDPAVYISFYGGESTQSMSMEGRIRRLQLLTGVQRDLVVQLEIDPEEAICRIEKRMSELALAGVNDKTQHMHENIDDLARLAALYEPARRHLQQIQPHRSVTIDTTDRTFDEVTTTLHSVVKAARNNDIIMGETIRL